METLHPVFTIGHSTHRVEQFNRDMLPEALAVAGIGYLRLPGITRIVREIPEFDRREAFN